MTTKKQTRYNSTINIQCPTWELMVKEIQQFCDANSQPNITAKVTKLSSDNLGYGIEIKLYNSDTRLYKIIYLTRYDLGIVITPKFEKKIPDSITWKMFGNRHREAYIAATIEVFSKSIR